MPDATPSPSQIIIQKIGALIIRNPDSFLKRISNLSQKGGKKTTLMLEFLILKSEEPEIVCNAFWGQFWFWVRLSLKVGSQFWFWLLTGSHFWLPVVNFLQNLKPMIQVPIN